MSGGACGASGYREPKQHDTEFDAEHGAEFGAELLRTLEAFMESRYNPSLAAQGLFNVRLTLINRLARIEEMTHVNLGDLHERTHLALSFVIMASR